MRSLTVLSWNTRRAGRDGRDERRAQSQVRLVAQVRPDIFLMQEAIGLDANEGSALRALEARIGMQGLLALAPRSGFHLATFLRPPLRAAALEVDAANFHHALATLYVELPRSSLRLTVLNAHLSPYGAAVRRREADHLVARGVPEGLCLLAGDLNSVSPHDPEPGGLEKLAPHHRVRYLDDDLATADRSVLARLESAGWVDIEHSLNGAGIPTVPTAAFVDTEFPVMRADYVLASQGLARCAVSSEVVRTPESDWASDHYPLVVRFKLPS